jgi:hypothetical protein
MLAVMPHPLRHAWRAPVLALLLAALAGRANATEREFRDDTRGRLSGTDLTLEALDSEPTLDRRDPLWRWRRAEAEYDCCNRLEVERVCREALSVLADAHRRGLAMAREPYAQCPAAQGLDTRPLQGLDTRPEQAERLCAPGPCFNERVLIARALAKRGTLMSTLLRPRCVPPAYDASLDVLAADFARHCQGEECLQVLGRMRAAIPGPYVRQLLAEQVEQVFPWVKRQVDNASSPKELAPLLAQLLGVDEVFTFELAVLLRGEVHPHLKEMQGRVLQLAPEPLTLRLLQLAREREEPGASGIAGLMLDLNGQGELSAERFIDTMERVPCTFFAQAYRYIRGVPSRAEIVSTQVGRRCPEEAEFILPALADLPPEELERNVSILGCEKIPWEWSEDPLGIRRKGSLEVHFDWIGRLCPRQAWALLTAPTTPLTPGVAKVALTPEQLRRFRFVGSTDLVFEKLEEAWRRNDSVTPEVFLVLARALGRQLTGELEGADALVRQLTWKQVPPDELRQAVVPLFVNAHPRVQAATAALLAELGVELPREPALACAEEHESRVKCLEGALHATGPHPGTAPPLRIVPPGSDPFYGAGPPNMRYWCSSLASRVEVCKRGRWNSWDTTCGGKPLTGEALARLAAAAGRPLSEVPPAPGGCKRWDLRFGP